MTKEEKQKLLEEFNKKELTLLKTGTQIITTKIWI